MNDRAAPGAGPVTQLDAAAIEALIPHSGRMSLLDGLLSWEAGRIVCISDRHREADHPLRSVSGLLASAAIEMAAQAMALHGALCARAEGGEARPGYLASARQVTLHRWRLDDLPGPLLIEAERQAGDERQLLYAFTVRHDGEPVAQGRAAVVLNTPI